ncbi:MAG: malate synthase G [Acidimicrobiales bacterium]|jgi:malate synthase|nr:malate synthase G [Acidimicrobiales bacterium]HJM27797.1 malate synthase G [Acidimicrobiales bacterium]
MGVSKVTRGSMQIDAVLYNFVNDSILPGTNREEHDFWDGFEKLFQDFSPRIEHLLRIRDDYQSQIDQWHVTNRDAVHNDEDYLHFLSELGYIQERPVSVQVQTSNVDPEVASVAAPQLVVPVDNARYAINAANARWGSLYDALYGTDVISEEGGAVHSGTYNPVRGAKVIAFARDLLDKHFPLVDGSHAESTKYEIIDSEIIASNDETDTRFANPEQFIGYTGSGETPESIFLKKHGLHIEIIFDPTDPIGADDGAGIADVMVESALSTIMDCEDSVATIDGDDKVLAYSNWLGLMRGDLQVEFSKGEGSIVRTLENDSPITGVDGSEMMIRRRSLMLVRNVGMHLMTDIVTLNGQRVPETLLDAVITTLCGIHDIQSSDGNRNSPKGSIYIVKPKMHGPDEVALSVEMFDQIESFLGLDANTVKIGIMDEERRTSMNLLACIAEARDRVVFINTGFLDRTGDEIHTSMEAGPFVPKTEMKAQQWLSAYEDINVDEGLAAGLLGHGQIGKGMWARPDDMADMLAEKIGHPESGASCAWVPSPTAATLHALHYLDIDVASVQSELENRDATNRNLMLKIPVLESGRELSPDEVSAELRNNAQGILGYVARWVGQGVGCSKVPDINNVQLMEDRATLRISSQHIANWLHHGIVTEEQILSTMVEMAAFVDEQNINDDGYHPMCGDLDSSISYQAALALIFEGRDQPNGYTEFLLTERRQRMKAVSS